MPGGRDGREPDGSEVPRTGAGSNDALWARAVELCEVAPADSKTGNYFYTASAGHRFSVQHPQHKNAYLVDPRPAYQTCDCPYKQGVYDEQGRTVKPGHATCKHVLGVIADLLKIGVLTPDMDRITASRAIDEHHRRLCSPEPEPVNNAGLKHLVAA
jgi:hypothetical protein